MKQVLSGNRKRATLPRAGRSRPARDLTNAHRKPAPGWQHGRADPRVQEHGSRKPRAHRARSESGWNQLAVDEGLFVIASPLTFLVEKLRNQKQEQKVNFLIGF
jgi:hypothetical protein